VARTAAVTPMHELKRFGQCHESLNKRLFQAIDTLFGRQRQQLATAAANLHALSPLATLQRGYSITRRIQDGTVVNTAAEVKVGERVETLLSHGRLTCEVIAVTSE